MRLTREQLEELKKKENVNVLWSWSKFNSFKNSPYEYYLKYIKHTPEDRTDAIYTTTGSIAHSILEKLYSNEINYKDMVDEFEDGWITAFDIAELKFDRNNEEHNQAIANKYYDNLKHFFVNHEMIPYKLMIEQFVKARVGDNLFQGYIDATFKDEEDNIHIIDFKTSSIYTGVKATKECGQLVLYAIGLNQKGIPFDKIKITWNFLKYCTVVQEQAKGNTKTRNIERCKLGESLQSNVKMWLKKLGYEDEADDYLKLLLDTNSISVLPEDVQKKYIFSDCYVYVDLTDKLVNGWITDILNTLNDIEYRTNLYNQSVNDGLDEETCSKAFWDSEESVKKNSFYFSTLCSYSAMLHKPYKMYLEKLENKNNNVFDGVGSNVEDTEEESLTESYEDKYIHRKTMEIDDIDLSWLNEL